MSIRIKVAALIAGISLLAMFLVGVVVFTGMTRQITDALFRDEAHYLESQIAEVSLHLERLAQIPLALRDVSILSEKENNGQPSAINESTSYLSHWEQRFRYVFEKDLQGARVIDQIRLIDRHGMERVRVEERQGRIVTVPDDELQDKSNRQYFQEAIFLDRDEVYVSELNLNREHNEIEVPYNPTMRFAVPVFYKNSKEVDALIIVNVRMQQVLDRIFQARQVASMALVDQDGYFVLHPDSKKCFSRMLNTGYNLFTEFPEFLTHNGDTNNVQSYYNPDTKYYQFWKKIQYEPSRPDRYWILISHINKANLMAPLRALQVRTAILGAGIMIAVFILSLYVSGRTTGRLIRLTRAVDQLGQSRCVAPLEEGSNDEIGRLSSAFSQMYTRLDQIFMELEQQKAAMDHHAIIATTDRKGDIIYVNDKFCDISKYSREELIGQNHRIINSGYHPREFFHDLWRTIASGRVWQCEICNRAKDGSFYWVDTTIVPFHDTTGRIEKYVSIRTDVTARKQVELELQKIVEDLEAKNSEMERFLYTISHDLRSPLVTTMGFLGFLSQDIAESRPDKVEEDLRRIQQAVETVEQLLSDLLELSRVGRVCNPPEEIPLQEIVLRASELLNGPLTEKKVQLEIGEDLPIVYVDQTRLIEVIQNIVENAVKYMGDQPDPRIAIDAEKEDGVVRIRIQDNGIGIDPKYQSRIFGLFDKLDPETPGTGIGLALVKRIVEFHGGTIGVESEGVGRGSTFNITLPLKKETNEDQIHDAAGQTLQQAAS